MVCRKGTAPPLDAQGHQPPSLLEPPEFSFHPSPECPAFLAPSNFSQGSLLRGERGKNSPSDLGWVVDLSPRDLVHMGCWKTPGQGQSGTGSNPFLDPAQDREPAGNSAILTHLSASATCSLCCQPVSAGTHPTQEGSGRGTLQQCSVAFLSWLACQRVLGLSPASAIESLSGPGQVTPCHL